MSEEENKLPTEGEVPKEPIVYASPMKRIWAWVGVGYMVIIVLLITYMFAFGRYLRGIGALMLCPAVVGIAATVIHLWQVGQKKDMLHRVVLAIIVGLCGALILMNLYTGIPALIANFGA